MKNILLTILAGIIICMAVEATLNNCILRNVSSGHWIKCTKCYEVWRSQEYNCTQTSWNEVHPNEEYDCSTPQYHYIPYIYNSSGYACDEHPDYAI